MSKRARILVVDDNEALRENMAECLEDEGYEVSTAADGAAALALLERGPLPDVVTMDLVMPGLDGRALAAAIRASPRLAALRLVLVTGQHDARPNGIAVDAVLSKPFSVDDLLATLARVAGQARRMGAG
jgi:CheY-like chemotaxis protein